MIWAARVRIAFARQGTGCRRGPHAPPCTEVGHEHLPIDDPRQLGFDFALWTRWMVRELIKRLFEVDPSRCCGSLAARVG